MKTEIIAIIDRSGSMSTLQEESIVGFNQFLQGQQAVPGEARMTTVLFSTEMETIDTGVTLRNATRLSKLNYQPNGYTALQDAICRTLELQGKRIALENWAENVIVCILTDGLENASRLHTAEDVRRMIEHAEKHGWSFIYLGANQDAFEVGAQYGISPQFTQTFAANSAGVRSAYMHTSTAATQLRTKPAGDTTDAASELLVGNGGA